MGSFSTSLVKVRRFLRDPDSNIWSDSFLMRCWNEVQQEFCQKVSLLETVNVYPYPPQWSWNYLHDFEHGYCEGDRYQALQVWQADSRVICYPWEPTYWETTANTEGVGNAFTIPWEAGEATPDGPVPMPLHQNMQKVKFAAFDEEPILPITQDELATEDPHYRTVTGTPVNYYRPDNYHNQVILYPRPSSITWQEWAIDDAYQDAGGINNWTEDYLDLTDTGVITDEFTAANGLLMIFDFIPYDVESGTVGEELQLPEFVLHYIEAGVLERAFGADTDGFLPSMRDYWKTRKDIGIQAARRYKAMKMSDRKIQMGGTRRELKSKLRLPQTITSA